MLATGLADHGLEVDVATTDPLDSLSSVAMQGNMTIRRFPTIGHDEVFLLSPRLAFWVLRHAGRYDLIHAHSYHTPLALVGAIAARLHRIPLVVTPHYHGTGHTKTRQYLHRPYRKLGAWMIRQAALLICNSEAECSLMHRDFGERPTKVVLPGVDSAVEPMAASEPSPNGTTVLAGGRLEDYKQVEVVVRAVQQLPPTFRLVVFGEGPALEQIQATAIDTGVVERVEFIGRVTDEDLAQRFRAANVFVSMSRKEAFGLTVLEAAAAGTAVVCSDIPAYREMAGRLSDGALRLVDVDSGPGAVADAVKASATAPRPTAPLRSALPSWEAMVTGVLDGYRGVLAARGRLQPEGMP